MTTELVSTKPLDPWGLAQIAKHRRTTPRALLEEVLSTSATYREAADRLGVTPKALRNYRKRYGLSMVRAPKEAKGETCPRCEGTGVVFGLLPVPGQVGQEFYGHAACAHGSVVSSESVVTEIPANEEKHDDCDCTGGQ